MGRFKRIIFIDEDNTGFSSLAAEMMKTRLMGEPFSPEVSSGGIVVLFPEPVNPKIIAAGKQIGIDLSGYRAKAVKDGDFSEQTLALTIDMEAKRRTYLKISSSKNTYTLREYVGEAGDVRTPAGGTVDDYCAVVRTIEVLIDKLTEKLRALEEAANLRESLTTSPKGDFS